MPPKPTTSKPARRLAKQLAALSIAVSTGALAAAPSLLRLRAELVAEAVDTVEAEFPTEDKARVYALLAHDPRTLVRGRVAEVVASLYPAFAAEAQSILQGLAGDASEAVRGATARGLSLLLERASFIHRLEMACQWAVSSEVAERAALAEALRSATVIPVIDWIVEQLAGDIASVVRLSAARAALQRYPENPAAFGRLLEALSKDADPAVRTVAAERAVLLA